MRRLQKRPASVLALAAVLFAAAVALGACGGSSKPTTSTTANAAATTPGAAAGAGGGGFGFGLRNLSPARRAQVQSCLKAQGVSLPPRRNPGAPRGGGGGLGLFGGGGRAANNPAFQRLRAAEAKCGLTLGRGAGGGGFRTNPAFRQQLLAFVSCVRRNGFNLPAPNLSGTGPVFNPKQVNQKDPKFVAAAQKCRALIPRFGRGGAGAGATGTGTGGGGG